MSPPRRRDREALVRPYLITGGRAHPSGRDLDLTALVRAERDIDHAELGPEHGRVVQLCSGGALSIAEIAAHLELPASVTRVIVSDLVERGCLSTMSTEWDRHGPDREILQEVLDGLRALR
ncbi:MULTISPECIES: DUF742 domain-containing protein [Actinopolyspora]|uniref:DUF742 domain-containing protein n=1 Tax=Actinopolyspora saharensis TaxID=995062 RepID=A0A1H0ZI14_9ACTN|nr:MULTISPECIES: DUF742 domain-containing protein [Actinopolyspora]NHD15777.1 DUF742 domain-containing protein [Actinopolyspora sp. BKK2]NHE75009.1 DUF742 domain-containing protein [Actinopolyspora sp. BKK1]SDQ27103.1 Protein of unknown function [Actinopolyspora saharensis]